MSDSPQVTVNPAMCSGEPCIMGRRIPVYMVADMVWHWGVDEAIKMWDLTRGEVLVACWYAAVVNVTTLYARGGLARRKRPEPWRGRWIDWAEQVSGDLWRASTVDYDTLPDPPGKGGTP